MRPSSEHLAKLCEMGQRRHRFWRDRNPDVALRWLERSIRWHHSACWSDTLDRIKWNACMMGLGPRLTDHYLP